jgi:hypothetical protein
MYYKAVFKELNERGVKYLVVGGVALVLHGVVRLTVDLDLMLKMNEKNLTKFVSAMESLGYKPKVPVKAVDFINPEKRKKWAGEKGMKVFSFYSPLKSFMIVDVLLGESINFDEAFGSKVTIDVRGVKIPVVSVKHLKALKKMSGRGQDLADVKSLEKLKRIKHGK